MNFGFNSNVDVGGTRYHVQSEDHGPAQQFLETLVYVAGRIVHKRRTNYPQNGGATQDEFSTQKLHESLAQQHRDVIAQLDAGTLVLTASTSAATLQVALLNPQSWLSRGEANLEIQISTEPARAYGAIEVTVFLEFSEGRSPQCQAIADESGRAKLSFPLSAMADGATLAIYAVAPGAQGELRFRLRARRKSPATPAE